MATEQEWSPLAVSLNRFHNGDQAEKEVVFEYTKYELCI